MKSGVGDGALLSIEDEDRDLGRFVDVGAADLFVGIEFGDGDRG